MAHVQKFSSGSAARIIGHCEREKSDNGDYLKYRTNSDIDTSKTALNMPMNFNDDLTAHERLAKRLDEVYVLKRKDVNVMCDWVVTYPQELPQEETALKNFFGQTSLFLFDRYGKENCVSCNIHMDEAQPHMHFCFVPVTYDQKKERYKVSAKEVLNKKDLTTFHSDLENHLQETLGIEKGLVLSGVTEKQGGNKSIKELKAKENELKKLENSILSKKNELMEADIELSEKKAQIEEFELIKDDLTHKIVDLVQDIPDLRDFIKEYQSELTKTTIEFLKTLGTPEADNFWANPDSNGKNEGKQPRFSDTMKSKSKKSRQNVRISDKSDDFDLDL